METSPQKPTDETERDESVTITPQVDAQDQKIQDDDDDKQNTSLAPQQQQANPNKVEILLKPVGNAPILKKKKFSLERTKDVKWLNEWLKKYMKLDPKEQLFLYVNQEFAPCLDTQIGTIFDCFGISNNIIFHYCTTPAWG